MSTSQSSSGYRLDGYAEVVQRLTVEFADRHSSYTVTAAVMKANTDLRRLAQAGTTYTLLEHARHRLRQLPPTRGS